jgi:putative aldouronate transport system permease protein
MLKMSTGERIFQVFNYVVLTILALLCLLPFVYLISVSLSSSAYVSAGEVSFWPKGFTVSAYEEALKTKQFYIAAWTSVRREILTLAVQMFMLIITAYPLSKTDAELPGRKYFSWFYIFTMLFSGGLIPTYLIVSKTGLVNTIWAWVLPGCVSAWNLVVVMNFMRGVPKELEEAAVVDGANQLWCLIKVYIPLSKPVLAAMVVFIGVSVWNDWFTGMLYMNNVNDYPLMTYLQMMLKQITHMALDQNNITQMAALSNESLRAARILIATTPILIIYPFMQKYFISGMTLGGLKG